MIMKQDVAGGRLVCGSSSDSDKDVDGKRQLRWPRRAGRHKPVCFLC